jgi:hypothetical protein
MLAHQVGEGRLITIFRARQGVVRSLHSFLFPLSSRSIDPSGFTCHYAQAALAERKNFQL